MSVTYYVALPFVRTEAGSAGPGPGMSERTGGSAKSRGDVSRSGEVGALALTLPLSEPLKRKRPPTEAAYWGLSTPSWS